jgi:hypothetical protein
VARGDGITALVHMGSGEPIARMAARPFSFSGSHYDGVYFYAIARDPLARGQAHDLIDAASYRYGHPGYGWLTWTASGAGRPRAVPYALLGVALIGIAVAAAAASFLAREVGMSPWWGLSVAVNPGLLLAVSVDTSETVMLALTFLAVLAWMKSRWLSAGLAIGVGCFTKEPLLLIPAGLLLWECIQLRRRGRPSQLYSRLGAIIAGPSLYFVWILYAGYVFGSLPFEGSTQITFPPVMGLVETLRLAAVAAESEGGAQFGLVAPALLVSVAGVFLLAVVRAVRLRWPLDAIFILMAGLIFCENWWVLLFPKDLMRTVAVPLALLPFVIARKRRPFLQTEAVA